MSGANMMGAMALLSLGLSMPDIPYSALRGSPCKHGRTRACTMRLHRIQRAASKRARAARREQRRLARIRN